MSVPLASKQGALNPLKNADPKAILDRYLQGETGPQIAQSFGVTKAALSYFLIKHAEDEWKSAQLIKALERKDNAETLMETADTALDLARARELLKAAQWDLERVHRRLFGQDQQASSTERVRISINVGGRSQGATIDASTGQVIESQEDNNS